MCEVYGSEGREGKIPLKEKEKDKREIHFGPASSLLLGHLLASAASHSLHPPLPTHPRALWCAAHSIVSAFRSAQFEWQAVTDQFPAKAARQAGVTGQEGI